MLVFLFIILIVSLFWTIWCVRLLLKKYKYFEEIAEKFVNYLETKNDTETLYKIGEYNIFGHKERRRVWPSAISYLRSKYKETNEIECKNYADICLNGIFDLILTFLGIFMGFAFFGVSLNSVFSILKP
jgi:hypothetical protein